MPLAERRKHRPRWSVPSVRVAFALTGGALVGTIFMINLVHIGIQRAEGVTHHNFTSTGLRALFGLIAVIGFCLILVAAVWTVGLRVRRLRRSRREARP